MLLGAPAGSIDLEEAENGSEEAKAALTKVKGEVRGNGLVS